MKTSKTAIVVHTIAGKVSSIIGYAAVILFGAPLVAGAYGGGVGVYIVVLVLMAIGVLLIVHGAKEKHRIKRYKQYVSLISNEQITSLQNLASAIAKSTDFVQNDIQKMIDRKFFSNASIDLGTGEIVIGSPARANENTAAFTPQNVPPEMETVKCQGCGATNSKQKGMSGQCEYCGSAL